VEYFGCDEIKTPQLDRLTREDICLTRFYVNWHPCTPVRGSLLTGGHGIYDMIRNETSDSGKKYTLSEYDVTFEQIGGMDRRAILLPAMLRKPG